MNQSLSIIVPALNEEANLEDSLSILLRAMKNRIHSYELFIFDDGSTDQTAAVAKRLAQNNKNITIVHHPKTMGLGYCIASGIRLATRDYVMWYPGDGGTEERSIETLLDQIGNADIVVACIANPKFRPKERQFFSKLYVIVMNVLFGLNLKYFNGLFIYRTEIAKLIHISARRYTVFAELLIQAVKAGYSYLEVPNYNTLRVHGASKAVTLKNGMEILTTIARLFWKIYIQKITKVPLSKSISE